MAIRIPFDAADNPESPTVVLAKRNGEKLGQIDAKSISISDSFNDAAELSFKVYKEINGVKCALWDEITNFKLVYCLEWNQWFEITVELDESNETVKTVFGTELGYAELGQINLYNIEINTEEDIARDDYKEPTVLFNETNPKASLLHRIMEKAPHYTITHVDNSIAKIQRTFSFDDESIMDAFQDIAEEIKCIFILKAETDGKTGELKRTIEVYDLQNYCPDCGHRWDSVEQDDICPECGKENVKPGYGDDTTIFVTSDELADDIGFDTDTDAVKNCFKLEGGDDLMTATIRNCNPNGTDYLWYFSDDMKHEMPKELVDKIESYDELYEYYQKEHVVMQTANAVLNQYNQLVDKYTVFNENLEKINVPIVGYPALMNAYYNTIDFNLYLTSSMMPSVETMETDANKELAKLTTTALSPVAVQNIDVISSATADNAVLSMARLIVDTRFKTTINSSSIVKGTNTCTWTGSFTVTNYYDEEDTATGGNIVITINENYVEFVRQKIEKQLSRDNNVEEIDIVSLFEKDYADFVNELRKYSLNRLKSFQAACQAVLDILIEQGIADKETWSSGDPNLYDDLYYPYLQKLNAINAEISLREQEISVIVGTKDTDGDVVKYGLQNYLDDYRDEIHKALDFEKYLGEELWLDFCAYRREDKYSNDNFISDALDNKELFDRAQEFIEIATQEIHKSAEQQHSISSNLKNLLVVDKFKPLVDSFSVGNWLRVMVDDTLYKLRLINYSIDYDDIENIDVEFSDVIKSKDSASDIQSVLDQASSMATSYDSVKRQAADGKNTSNMVSGWVSDGLDLTNMMIVGNAENQNIEWGERGLLAREYLPITDTYDDRQLKLINRGLYVTSDGWETARAGIGNFMFWNPKTKKTEEAYGVIADTIVGNIILSEEVGIYNKNNSITMDGDGFTLTTNADGTDPEDIFTIQKEIKDSSGQSSIEKLLYVDSSGNLTLNGAIRVVNSYSKVTTINDLGDPDRIITESNTIIADIRADINGLSSDYSQTKQTVSDLGIKTESLSSSLTQTAAAIRGELSSSISDVNGSINDLSTEIEATAGQLRVELNNSISDVNGSINDLSTKIDVTAGQLRVDVTTAVDAAGNAIDIVNGSIKTVDVEYGISNSPTVEPASNAWSTNSPQWQAGKYIWQRTKTTTPEGVSSYSKAVCIQGAKGQDGIDGKNGDYIADIFEQYYLSTSATKQEGGSWSTTQPAWSSGHYIWTRSEIHWIKYSSEGDPIAFTEYTEPVLAQAINSANENASYVRGFMEYNTTGLTIGRYATGSNDTVSRVKLASSGQLEVYDEDTMVAYFGSTARIGTSTGYNTKITSSGVNICSGTNVLSSFTGSSVTLGANSKSRMILSSSGLNFYQQYNNGSLHALSISASGGDVPSLTIDNVCGGYFYLTSGQTTVRIAGREFKVSESTGGEMLYLYGLNEQIKIFGNTLADWVTSQGTSGIWRYRKYKSGKVELFATVSMTFQTYGEDTKTVTFPTSITGFSSYEDYTVQLTLMSNSGSTNPDFNKIHIISRQMSASGFTIASWQEGLGARRGYRVAIHVFGW